METDGKFEKNSGRKVMLARNVGKYYTMPREKQAAASGHLFFTRHSNDKIGEHEVRRMRSSRILEFQK